MFLFFLLLYVHLHIYFMYFIYIFSVTLYFSSYVAFVYVYISQHMIINPFNYLSSLLLKCVYRILDIKIIFYKFVFKLIYIDVSIIMNLDN